MSRIGMRRRIGAWVSYRYQDEDEHDEIRNGYVSFSKTEVFNIDECDEFGVPDSEISFYMNEKSFVDNVCPLFYGSHDGFFFNPNIDDFEIKLVNMKYRYATIEPDTTIKVAKYRTQELLDTIFTFVYPQEVWAKDVRNVRNMYKACDALLNAPERPAEAYEKAMTTFEKCLKKYVAEMNTLTSTTYETADEWNNRNRIS